jgi:ArsR family transcriptional regulator
MPRGARVNERQIAELAEMFRLMGDGSRLGILLACLEGPVAVGALAARLDLSPSLVSHHLRLLRAARLVRARRRGRQVFYEMADDHVRRVLTDMVEHVAEMVADGGAALAREMEPVA